METSNLIALGALAVAFIGLIPSFYQAFAGKRTADDVNNNENKTIIKSSDHSKSQVEDTKKDSTEPNTKPLPIIIRVLVISTTAIIIYLTEIILFSLFAHLNSIQIELTTMPLIWLIAFYSLFIIPGIMLFFAFVVFTTMFSD